MFTTYWIPPEIPTTLGSREWLPLPPTDYCFYPMVNSWTIPEALDVDRLKKAVSQALRIYPLNAAKLTLHPDTHDWQLHLVNRSIPLRIGTSPRPGPFARDWKGEKDPDYYDEMPRSGSDLSQYRQIPLAKLLVTTYEPTGQTSIMLSQSYNLGDGFAVIGFVKAISSFYQGLEPNFIPTFEKYCIPDPQLLQSASYAEELQHISWLAANFSDDQHHRRAEEMEVTTSRVDVDFPSAFVDHLKAQAQRATGISRLSRGDVLAGYIASVLFRTLDPAPRFLQQCIGFRGQALNVNGTLCHIPTTSLGTCYMIYAVDRSSDQNLCPSEISKLLHQSRHELANDEHLSKTYAMYSHLYKLAALSTRAPFDAGHPDAIAFNNCLKIDSTGAHFGFPGQTGFIEWEVLENFVQFQEAGPQSQPDGSLRQIPGDVNIVTRLTHYAVPRVLRQFEKDVQPFQRDLRVRVLGPARLAAVRSHL